MIPAQKIRIWRVLQCGLAVLLVAVGVWKLLVAGITLHPPHVIEPFWLAAAVLAGAGVSLGNTELAYGHLKLHDTRVSFADLWRVNLWGSLFNLVLPFGLGALMRGAWLKSRHQMSISEASRHVLETNLIVFVVNFWLLALILASKSWNGWLLAALLISGAAMASLPAWRPLILPALLPYPFSIAAYLSICHALQLDIGLSFLLVLPLMVHASALLVLAPGSLGVTESLFILFADILSLPVSDALWLALATRAAALVAVVLLLLGLTAHRHRRERS